MGSFMFESNNRLFSDILNAGTSIATVFARKSWYPLENTQDELAENGKEIRPPKNRNTASAEAQTDRYPSSGCRYNLSPS